MAVGKRAQLFVSIHLLLEFLKESHGAMGRDKHKAENESLKDSSGKVLKLGREFSTIAVYETIPHPQQQREIFILVNYLHTITLKI